MTDHRTQPDGHLGTAQMRMLWTIARSLAANAAAKGRDVAAFQGFALCARRLAVSSAGACLVRVVVLYGMAADRALKGLPWEAEDELESFVVTLPMPQRQASYDALADQETVANESVHGPAAPYIEQELLSSPPHPQSNHPRWLSQPVRCTSRIAQTGVISRDPVAARPGGTCPFVNPPGDVHPRSGMGVPLHGHPRV